MRLIAALLKQPLLQSDGMEGQACCLRAVTSRGSHRNFGSMLSTLFDERFSRGSVLTSSSTETGMKE